MKAARNSAIMCACFLAVIEGVGIGFQRMMAENTRLDVSADNSTISLFFVQSRRCLVGMSLIVNLLKGPSSSSTALRGQRLYATDVGLMTFASYPLSIILHIQPITSLVSINSTLLVSALRVARGLSISCRVDRKLF